MEGKNSEDKYREELSKFHMKIVGGKKDINFGGFFSAKSFLQSISSKKMVFLGETHGVNRIISLQMAIQNQMIQDKNVKLNVVMEHFSFEMQHLLD